MTIDVTWLIEFPTISIVGLAESSGNIFSTSVCHKVPPIKRFATSLPHTTIEVSETWKWQKYPTDKYRIDREFVGPPEFGDFFFTYVLKFIT